METTALILIATGDKYWQYIKPMIDSAKTFFIPHQVVLFTDSTKDFGVITFKKTAYGFPNETLLRYRTILSKKDFLSKFDYLFYCDIDMLFVDKAEDVLSDGITATLHPGYVNGQKPPLEKNTNSMAYLQYANNYFCGGFNGGRSADFLKLASVCNYRIEIDLSRGIVAKWHDESHLNRYLFENPPTKILSPSYCYPETNLRYYQSIWGNKKFKPILLALTKTKIQQQTQTSGTGVLNNVERFAAHREKIKII